MVKATPYSSAYAALRIVPSKIYRSRSTRLWLNGKPILRIIFESKVSSNNCFTYTGSWTKQHVSKLASSGLKKLDSSASPSCFNFKGINSYFSIGNRCPSLTGWTNSWRKAILSTLKSSITHAKIRKRSFGVVGEKGHLWEGTNCKPMLRCITAYLYSIINLYSSR